MGLAGAGGYGPVLVINGDCLSTGVRSEDGMLGNSHGIAHVLALPFSVFGVEAHGGESADIAVLRASAGEQLRHRLAGGRGKGYALAAVAVHWQKPGTDSTRPMYGSPSGVPGGRPRRCALS